MNTTSLSLQPSLYRWLSLLAFSSCLIVIPAVQADATQDKPPMHGMDNHMDNHSGDHNGPNSDDMDDMRGGPGHMMEELNLTDSQRKAFQQAMKERMTMMRDVKQLHEQLRDLTEADSFDEAKIREAVRKHNSAMENDIVYASKAMHDFYASLSPEQKTKLKQMHEEMKDNMKDHMRDRMMEHHDGKQGSGNQ